jgi:hypothetical protein
LLAGNAEACIITIRQLVRKAGDAGRNRPESPVGSLPMMVKTSTQGSLQQTRAGRCGQVPGIRLMSVNRLHDDSLLELIRKNRGFS